jgi:hypothetical protein
MKAALHEVFNERELEKKALTYVCSDVTRATVSDLLRGLHIKVIDAVFVAPSSSVTFGRFDWRERREDDKTAMTDLLIHLRNQFAASIGEGCGFQLLDVHSITNFLNLDDEKFAKISGGTDFIILPQNVASESYASEICVVFEAKTTARLSREGIESNTPQLIIELLAARYHSDQPRILAVLSDFNSVNCAMEIDFIDNAWTIKKYANLNLNQLGGLIFNYLRSPAAVPRANYVPAVSSDGVGATPAEEAVVGFKRKFKTDLFSTLAWEHYTDMMQGTGLFSTERRQLTNQLFSSWGVELRPTVDNSASMYI